MPVDSKTDQILRRKATRWKQGLYIEKEKNTDPSKDVHEYHSYERNITGASGERSRVWIQWPNSRSSVRENKGELWTKELKSFSRMGGIEWDERACSVTRTLDKIRYTDDKKWQYGISCPGTRRDVPPRQEIKLKYTEEEGGEEGEEWLQMSEYL